MPGISDRLLEPAPDKHAIGRNRDEIITASMARIGVVQRRQREAGSWVIDEEPLGEGDGWQDWPAFHRVATTDRARIRFLVTPPGATATTRAGVRRVAEHEYRITGMTAVFTALPQFTVLAGRQEIGRTDPMLLTERTDGPRLLLLGGRSWKVTWIDWKRRRCYVEPAAGGGKARWLTPGISGASLALTRAARDVLLGAEPPVARTQRAQHALAEVREEHVPVVHPGGTVITREGEDVRWWTWAGYRANATLAATLSELTDSNQRFDDAAIRMRADLTHEMWKAAIGDAAQRLCLPEVDDRALAGLKFNEALPKRLAAATLAARLADLDSAAIVLGQPVRFFVGHEGRG